MEYCDPKYCPHCFETMKYEKQVTKVSNSIYLIEWGWNCSRSTTDCEFDSSNNRKTAINLENYPVLNEICPHLDPEIQMDLLMNVSYLNKKRIYPGGLFDYKPYWSNLRFNAQLNSSSPGNTYKIYDGGLGMGNYIHIYFKPETKQYCLLCSTFSNRDSENNLESENTIWCDWETLKTQVNEYFNQMLGPPSIKKFNEMRFEWKLLRNQLNNFIEVNNGSIGENEVIKWNILKEELTYILDDILFWSA